MSEGKKRLLTGVQPTGRLTIGNYLGATKVFCGMQEEYECFYFIADLHSLTVAPVPSELRNNTISAFAQLVASGVDPNKTTLFVQSHVPSHSKLAWVLNCFTYFGEAKRMHQFKDKSAKNADNINVGLFAYPVLQASDILLYNPDVVPVGVDQKQHIELTRNIAERFNNKYSPTFTLPDCFTPKTGSKIMSLQEPSVKMSKSDPNENAYILMLDEPDVIVRKIKRAVTDSDGRVVFDAKNKAGVSNLLTILSAFSGRKIADLEADFVGKGYGQLKDAVATCIIDGLASFRQEYYRLMQDREYLLGLMQQGAQRANYIAEKTVSKVYKKVGLVLA